MTGQPMNVTHQQVEKVRKALPLFVGAALLESVALIVLVVEMVMRYALHNDALNWWPFVHGWIYIVFVLATVNLGFAARWSLGKMALALVSGLVPFVSFWAERVLSKDVRAQLAAWGAAQRDRA